MNNTTDAPAGSLRRMVRLVAAVRDARPVLKHFENVLAASLSCDDRSHDGDREPRRQLNEILNALADIDEPNDKLNHSGPTAGVASGKD